MAITSISVLRRDPALANASGLIAGPAGGPGSPGTPGGPGIQGDPGRGVASMFLDDRSHLLITYTDGSVADAGAVAVTMPITPGSDGGEF